MRHKRFVSVITLGSALLAGRATPALAQRETVIPQVADGAGAVRTKLDIANLSSAQAISKLRIFFFQRDGTPWTLATNQGTASQFLLSIGKNQVFRVETLYVFCCVFFSRQEVNNPVSIKNVAHVRVVLLAVILLLSSGGYTTATCYFLTDYAL